MMNSILYIYQGVISPWKYIETDYEEIHENLHSNWAQKKKKNCYSREEAFFWVTRVKRDFFFLNLMCEESMCRCPVPKFTLLFFLLSIYLEGEKNHALYACLKEIFRSEIASFSFFNPFWRKIFVDSLIQTIFIQRKINIRIATQEQAHLQALPLHYERVDCKW